MGGADASLRSPFLTPGPADRGSMRPHNFVEEAVFATTERLVSADPDFCGCEKCVADVEAHALAHLAPAYASSREGATVTRIVTNRPAEHAEVTVRVTESIALVKANPRH